MLKNKPVFPRLFLYVIAVVILFAVFLSARKFIDSHYETGSYGEGNATEWRLPQAALLWTRGKMIMYSLLKPWHPVQVVDGESPRWSPDGTSIVFTRGHDVWMMDRKFGRRQLLFKDVVTEGGTGAFWTRDGKALTAINLKNPHQVLMYDLATRKISVIHDEGKPPFHKYRLSQSAELRIGNRYLLTFTEDDGHSSIIVDLKQKEYIANDLMKAGDCNPSWAPNGKFLVTTRRAWVRPVYITQFSEVHGRGKVGKSEYLIGAGRSHWPSVANDSKYVVYSDHNHIYIWQIGRPVDGRKHGVQLTHSSASDISPNIHIFQDQH